MRFDPKSQTLENRFQFSHHLIIPIPQHSKSLHFKPTRSLPVVIQLFAVLPSIQLNDQAELHTNEINDEIAQRHLPLEFQAHK